MADTAAIDEKARRVRSLLSSYYVEDQNDKAQNFSQGMPHTPTTGQGNPTASRVQSIDSATFDPSRYLAQVLRTMRLDDLLGKHQEMSMEIKTLDSDMQMLVYENYNKFISATDTIRSMKTNVDGMETNMQDLKHVIDDVADRSNTVNSKLQLRRDHIEQLNQVRALLVKLQAVFDLPKRLRTAIDRGAVEIAVDTYADAAPLLKRYGHKGAFRKVTAESEAAARELTSLLKARMAAEKDEVANCIQLIRKLGEPVETLQDEFLVCMEGRVASILREARDIAKRISPRSPPSPPSPENAEELLAWGVGEDNKVELLRFVVEVDQRFLTELAHNSAQFSQLFPPSGRSKLLKVARASFMDYIKLVKEAMMAAGAAEAKQATAALDLTRDGSGGGDWGTGMLADALYTFSNDVTRVHSLLPELALADRGSEVVEGMVRYHVGACFSALERCVMDGLAVTQQALREEEFSSSARAAGSTPSRLLSNALSSTSDRIISGTESVLRGMTTFQKRDWLLRSWRDVFVDLVQGQLQHLFLSLLSGFMAMAGLQSEPDQATSARGNDADTNSVPAGLLLLEARVCMFMEQQAVIAVMDALATHFPGQGTAAGADQPPAFVAGEVARRLGMGAAVLARAYVDAQGRKLSLALRRSAEATNWLQHKEPRGPRPVTHLLLELLAASQAQVTQLVPEAQGGVGGGRERGHSRGANEWGSGGNALERNLARLFHQPLASGDLDFSQSSILSGIARMSLKSWVEGVRLQTLGRAGLQQIQVDCHFLQPHLRRFASGQDAAALQLVMEEVMTAAMDRALQPILLDPPLLDRLVGSAPPFP